MIVGNKSEKEYRDKQTNFGHIHQSRDLKTWLNETYSPDSNKEKRYHKVADKFLNRKHNLKVFEIAAGVGDFVAFCSKLFPQHTYYANELSDVMLSQNIGIVAEHFDIKILPELSYEEVEKLHYPDNTFDVIFIKAAVHHFEDPFKGLSEIYRVLKPDGELVCIEEPVCLNIPSYREWKKRNNCIEERAMGVNEHIYTIPEYLSFGKDFSKKGFYIDEELIAEYDRQHKKRGGIGKIAGALIRRFPFLFKNYLIWRFAGPLIFVYKK